VTCDALPSGYLLPPGETMRDVMLRDEELFALEERGAVHFERPWRVWLTPDHPEGEIFKIHEMYVGLRGQQRVAFVDNQGRIGHYDREEVQWAERNTTI
jgi:hypothetical protein